MKQTPTYITTKLRFIAVVKSIALAAAFAYAGSAAQAQTYSLTDLGVLPGKEASMPAAINEQGQVAGTSSAGTSSASAFRYTNSGKAAMEDVSGKPGSISRGFGINSSGQVVGDSNFGNPEVSRAALFVNGSARDLGTLKTGGPFSRATGINAAGQVVGFSSEKPDLDLGRAFIVNTAVQPGFSTRLTDLGTLGGDYAQALAINDFGFVTGNSQVGTNYGPTHAFIWQSNTKMVDLGTIKGDFSTGTAINAKNHVVGYSTINRVDDRVHAFLYDGQKMLDLGSLGAAYAESDRSFALGVNAHDQVVGYSYLPPQGPIAPRQVAFIYSQGKMLDLNELIGTAAKQYRLHSATAINDKGQIAAIAFDNSANAFRAVLLTPNRIGSR
jgi:probable HAF family extracellular repeat protein